MIYLRIDRVSHNTYTHPHTHTPTASPFAADDEQKTYHAIANYTSPSTTLKFSPAYCSTECQSFISALLTPNPISRLGSRQGAEEAMAHKWFKVCLCARVCVCVFLEDLLCPAPLECQSAISPPSSSESGPSLPFCLSFPSHFHSPTHIHIYTHTHRGLTLPPVPLPLPSLPLSFPSHRPGSRKASQRKSGKKRWTKHGHVSKRKHTQATRSSITPGYR